MSTQKFRWSRVYESSEEELVTLLQSRNIQSTCIVVEAGSEPTEEQQLDYDTTMWCAEGSLTLRTGATNVSLQAGDAIRIDAGTSYSLQPGIAGYTCYLTT